MKFDHIHVSRLAQTPSLVVGARAIDMAKHLYGHKGPRLGNIADLVYGEPLVEADRTGGGFPVIGSNGIVGYHDEALIPGPAVIIGRKGAAGAVTYVDGPCWPIDTTFFLRFRPSFKGSRKLLAYLLRYVDLSQLTLRKAVPGLNRDEAMAVRLPTIPDESATGLAAQIQVIEKSIAAARAGLRKPNEIIDEILCAEFGYPLKEYRERERAQHFTANIYTMTTGFTLRNSAKFHHPSFELTEQFFSRKPHERVKAFISIPIRLGATTAQTDLVEDGDVYYVHPGATRKQEVIALKDCYKVTEAFYAATQRRFGLRRNDVVLNRAGEGTIGKSGFWVSDEPALASDFTMRIRFNNRINPRFGWYYIQSVMFQAQVTREKRGMGNMTNIFPPEVERMFIVACKRSKQDTLACEIKAELQRRSDALASIKSKKAEINMLIDEAIRG